MIRSPTAHFRFMAVRCCLVPNAGFGFRLRSPAAGRILCLPNRPRRRDRISPSLSATGADIQYRIRPFPSPPTTHNKLFSDILSPGARILRRILERIVGLHPGNEGHSGRREGRSVENPCRWGARGAPWSSDRGCVSTPEAWSASGTSTIPTIRTTNSRASWSATGSAVRRTPRRFGVSWKSSPTPVSPR